MNQGKLASRNFKSIIFLTLGGLIFFAIQYNWQKPIEESGNEEIRGYHLGNSFTTDCIPMLFPELVRAVRKEESVYIGYFIRGGTSLRDLLSSFLDEVPDSKEDFFQKSWNYFSLQPWVFGNSDTLKAEIDAFNEFILLTRGNPGTMEAKRNGGTVFYLYVPWTFQNPQHGENGTQFTRSETLSELWESGKYKREGESIEQTRNRTHYTHNKAMFDDFYQQLLADNPRVKIYQIPVGYILNELDKSVRANPIRKEDGALLMDNIFVTSGIFRDYLHLNFRGQYVANTTTACIILDTHPSDIPLANYFKHPSVTPEFIKVANDVIWNYLTQHEAVTGITVRAH